MILSEKQSEAMSQKRTISDISSKIVTLRLSDCINQQKDNYSLSVEKNFLNCSATSLKMSDNNSQLPRVDPVNHSVLSKANNKSVTTPPNASKIPTPMPLAPVKQKNCRIMTGLKPKKLVYVDEESEILDWIPSTNGGFLIADSSLSNYQTSNEKIVTPKENILPKTKPRKMKDTNKKSNSVSDENTQIFRRVTRSLSKFYNENNKENLGKSLIGKAKNKEDSNDKNKLWNFDENNCRKSLKSLKKADVKLKEISANCTQLSQCSSDLSWQEMLRWLQPRRDVGLWIECSHEKCKKWRYVEEYHDPIDVPEQWFCEMNSDQSVASCSIPEVPRSKEIEDDMIENKYNAGSIVWARIRGFPWWPAMVDDSPKTMSYYKLSKSSIPTAYHVIFFSEKIETAWITCANIKAFVKHSIKELVKTTVFRKVDYKNDLNAAHALAQNAIKLSILERLQKYSFLAKFERNSVNSVIGCSKNLEVNDNTRETSNSSLPVKKKISSSKNTPDVSYEYALSPQLTTDTTIFITANLQHKDVLAINCTDSEEDYIPNSQPEVLLKRKFTKRQKPLSTSSGMLLTTQWNHLTKDNVIDNGAINSAISNCDYAVADTISLTHNTDLEKDRICNSQFERSSLGNHIWKKSQSTNNNELFLPSKESRVSPNLPRKQIKLSNVSGSYVAAPIEKNILQHSDETSRNVINFSCQPLSNFDNIRKRWEENTKKYRNNMNALNINSSFLSG